MPSRELNKVVKMAFDTESCTAKSKAESNDEGYEEAEKNLQWGSSRAKTEIQSVCRSTCILVLKLIKTAALFVSIFQSVEPHNSCSERFKYIKPVQPPEN